MEPTSGKIHKNTLNALKQELHKMSKNGDRPLLIVTGDIITNVQNDGRDLKDAKNWFKKLSADVPGLRILLCPGNHDCSWMGLFPVAYNRQHFNANLHNVALPPMTFIQDGNMTSVTTVVTGEELLHFPVYHSFVPRNAVNRLKGTGLFGAAFFRALEEEKKERTLHFIGLDSMQGKTVDMAFSGGKLGAEQLTKLRIMLNQIANSPKKNKVVVVYLHHNPFLEPSPGHEQDNFGILEDRAQLLDILNALPHSDDFKLLLLCGHTHKFEMRHCQASNGGHFLFASCGRTPDDHKFWVWKVPSTAQEFFQSEPAGEPHEFK